MNRNNICHFKGTGENTLLYSAFFCKFVLLENFLYNLYTFIYLYTFFNIPVEFIYAVLSDYNFDVRRIFCKM